MNNLTDYTEYLKHLKSLNRETINIDEVINSLSKVKSITSEIKEVERPIVEHKYTQGDWFILGDEYPSIETKNLDKRTTTTYPTIATVNSILRNKEEYKANARLITQAPKMHILCEAMFDMLKNTNSLYLPTLEDVLNTVNPK